MNDTDIAAELERAKRELENYRAADTPSLYQQKTTTPAMREAHARAERERIQGAIKERQERDAKLAEEREAARLQRASDDLEVYKDQQRERWVKATGSVAGFEAAWPGLRADFALKRMGAVERATAELRSAHGGTL